MKEKGNMKRNIMNGLSKTYLNGTFFENFNEVKNYINSLI